MKVLVVGARGMLGQDLVPALVDAGHEVVSADRTEAAGSLSLDIADWSLLRAVMADVRPQAVINAAAYTNVDGAESDEDAAYLGNALGPWNLALACQEFGADLMHVSTDYVFDGLKGSSYDEYDLPNPQGVYGRSKLAGERHIQQILSRHYIVRTAWLYGQGGKNFIEAIAGAAQARPELKVVNDQWGCPTSTQDLARTMVALLETGRFGVYHATGSGECTWWDFARYIVQAVGLETPVLTQTTEELARPAPRPRYSVLKNRALAMAGLPLLPPWQESVDRYLQKRSQPVG